MPMDRFRNGKLLINLLIVFIVLLATTEAESEDVLKSANDLNEDKAVPQKIEILIDDNLDYNKDCKSAIQFARDRGIGKKIKLHDENGEREVETMELFEALAVLELEVVDDNNTENVKYEFQANPLLTCLQQDDEKIQQFLRGLNKIIPPSKNEYNLDLSIDEAKVQTKVASEVDQIVFHGKKKGGFFIEAGAHNFEFDSDTLLFENDHEWTGLLVEPDPLFFQKGLKKNRKAHAINNCLSTETRPTIMNFNIDIHSFMNATEAHPPVMCYPLYSILKALGNPTVDYFSLDVEGAEFPILKTIPWDKVDIRAISIETHFAGFLFPGSREDIIAYMIDKGYKHIPYGHEIDKQVVWPSWNNFTHALINDMFVKEEIEVKSGEEVYEMRRKAYEAKKTAEQVHPEDASLAVADDPKVQFQAVLEQEKLSEEAPMIDLSKHKEL